MKSMRWTRPISRSATACDSSEDARQGIFPHFRISTTPSPTRPTASTTRLSGPGSRTIRHGYAATLIYVRTAEGGIPATWEHVHYTRAEVDQTEAVIIWYGELIKSYALMAASEKITRLVNETVTMLRDKRAKVEKSDGTIAARNVIARMGKAEFRTDAGMRDQVIDPLVSHHHLIPVARKGHYLMVVPHS